MASGEASNSSQTRYSEESSVRALYEMGFYQPNIRSYVDGDDVRLLLANAKTWNRYHCCAREVLVVFIGCEEHSRELGCQTNQDG